MSADRLISYSQRAPGISIAEFLRQANGHERFYWEKGDLAFAGFGIATELTAWGAERVKTIEDKARKLFRDALVISDAEPLAKPRLFGGFSFYSDFVTENTWAAFAPAYFVLPHYQLVKRGADTWLRDCYGVVVLEGVKACIVRACKSRRTVNHRGRGRFMVAGETIKLASRMK